VSPDHGVDAAALHRRRVHVPMLATFGLVMTVFPMIMVAASRWNPVEERVAGVVFGAPFVLLALAAMVVAWRSEGPGPDILDRQKPPRFTGWRRTGWWGMLAIVLVMLALLTYALFADARTLWLLDITMMAQTMFWPCLISVPVLLHAAEARALRGDPQTTMAHGV
jgi:hypothetical protein